MQERRIAFAITEGREEHGDAENIIKHFVPPYLRLLRVLRRRHWCGVERGRLGTDTAAREGRLWCPRGAHLCFRLFVVHAVLPQSALPTAPSRRGPICHHMAVFCPFPPSERGDAPKGQGGVLRAARECRHWCQAPTYVYIRQGLVHS